MTFGNKLKKWRMIRGYSRRDMGEKLGISEAAYGLYETDRTKPDTSKLLALAEILQVSTDELLDFHLDEFARCKNFWEECGFRIEESQVGGIAILFNETFEQITVANGKMKVRLYDVLPLMNRKEFISLTVAVEERIKEQLQESRKELFNMIIQCAEDCLGTLTETEEGIKITYNLPRGKSLPHTHFKTNATKKATE